MIRCGKRTGQVATPNRHPQRSSLTRRTDAMVPPCSLLHEFGQKRGPLADAVLAA
jgi:hypothetical protein